MNYPFTCIKETYLKEYAKDIEIDRNIVHYFKEIGHRIGQTIYFNEDGSYRIGLAAYLKEVGVSFDQYNCQKITNYNFPNSIDTFLSEANMPDQDEDLPNIGVTNKKYIVVENPSYSYFIEMS